MEQGHLSRESFLEDLEDVDVALLKEIPGVVDARRINSIVNDRKEKCLSVLVFCDVESFSI